MSLAAHRIRRLTWLVRTPSASAAFQQRQTLRDALESTLVPALERAFDQFGSSNQVLYVPKLNLQIVTDDLTVADLARQIETQVRALLTRRVDGPAARSDVDHAASLDVRQDIHHRSAAEHRRDLLIGYLRSGRIGWQANTHETPGLIEWMRAEAESLLAEHPGGEQIILGTLETRVAMTFRWLQLLAPASRKTMLRSISLPSDPIVVDLLRLTNQPDSGNYGQLCAVALLLALRSEDLLVIRVRSVAELLTACSLPVVGGLSDACLTRLDENRLAASGPSAAAASPPLAVSHDRLASPPPNVAQPQIPPPNFPGEGFRSAAIDPPGVLACDAGLILLHPFLSRLFEATGLDAVTNGRLPAASLPRAAALLHWLATGREMVFEFELSLCKVFLGLRPTDPLPVSEGLLNDRDREEGNALLAAVIDHWSALRHTSVAGLRACFLERRGMLRDDEHGWRLQMETESFDLLLGQLPWSLTVVKLPWMTKPIFTEWPTP